MLAALATFLFATLASCDGGWADSPSFGNGLTTEETEFFGGQLQAAAEKDERVHMIEFGGFASTNDFSNHPAVESWGVVVHNHSLTVLYPGSSKVNVKAIPGDFGLWEKHQNPASEEGTFAEYENYISEIIYFGAKDKLAYWVTNFGKAKADVGIAVLPLLARTNGKMIVSDWSAESCHAETLLAFYDLARTEGRLAVLQPKTGVQLTEAFNAGKPEYSWCFTWLGGKKVVRREAGPSDTGSIMDIVQNDVGCQDMFADLHCEPGANGSSTCVSCYVALTSISKRGQWVRQSLRKVVKNHEEFEVENAAWTF